MKEERKFPLAEVHTKMGTEGEIIFDQRFMEVLDVQPGDWISFFIDEQGVVTVRGEKKQQEKVEESPEATILSLPRPDQITQTTLFSTEGSEQKGYRKHNGRKR